MRLLLSLVLTFSVSLSFAGTQYEAQKYDEKQVIEFVDSNIGSNNTCADDYLIRQNYLKKFLIWAPPITVVGAPTAFIIGGYTAAGLSTLAGVGGWSALGYTILGAFGSGFAALGTFTVMEISNGVEFINNQKMLNIITAANSNTLDHKAFVNFVNSYNKKFANNQKDATELAQIVTRLDQSARLCNGEVRGYVNPKNLKYSLAKRRHLIRFIGNNF
jgi:hypothetical protein